MSEIKLGKIIIEFPDSHKDVAEGLRDAIINELSEQEKEKPTKWKKIHLEEEE